MEIIISKEFLENLSSSSSRTLVGKILKRVDICQSKEELKNHLKEIIYEHYRDFETNLECYSKGYGKIRIEYNAKEQGK